MSKRIEVTLDNVDSVISSLEKLEKNIDWMTQMLVTEILEDGVEYAKKQYAAREHDPNITDINVDYNTKDMSGEIQAYGKDVVYEEFGTGDRGEQQQHPVKSKYNLNDYNSGPTIRNVSDVLEGSLAKEDLDTIGISSGKYWTYKKNGTVYYTQGVPSGQEMWKTRNYLLNNSIQKKVAEKGKELNDYIIASIKK